TGRRPAAAPCGRPVRAGTGPPGRPGAGGTPPPGPSRPPRRSAWSSTRCGRPCRGASEPSPRPPSCRPPRRASRPGGAPAPPGRAAHHARHGRTGPCADGRDGRARIHWCPRTLLTAFLDTGFRAITLMSAAAEDDGISHARTRPPGDSVRCGASPTGPRSRTESRDGPSGAADQRDPFRRPKTGPEDTAKREAGLPATEPGIRGAGTRATILLFSGVLDQWISLPGLSSVLRG